LPADPILRALLIQKGVITVEEIETMEKTLAATGVIRVADAT
jgi:hypothetical protein